MGAWHNRELRLEEEIQNRDDEIAELRAEIKQLKDMLAAHNIRKYDAELEDYKKMHPEEQ